MACGTPVVAADNSSLPEVVGDAGLQVNAGDVEALASALGRLVSNAELREELRTEGQARARRFTWEKAAHQLLGIYNGLRIVIASEKDPDSPFPGKRK
jgi:glycosyltransferase involved in cell wall biosynthesis